MPFENASAVASSRQLLSQQKENSISPKLKGAQATPSIKIPIQFSSRSLYSNNNLATQIHNQPTGHHYTIINAFNSGRVGEPDTYSNYKTKTVQKNVENNFQYMEQQCMVNSNDLLNSSAAIAHASLSPPFFDGNSYNHRFGSPFSHNLYKPSSESSNSSLHLRNQFNERSIQVALENKRISAFLPVDEVLKNEKEQTENNEIIQQIYTENYDHDGRIDNMTRVMSFHPIFLNEYVKFHNYLMYSQGALPYELRHYIAIMAAARHKCLYLVHQQEAEFISQKGQSTWLLGLPKIPQKLQDLSELNKLICHQPWLINKTHIVKLLKNQFNSWSITELIMAVTILIHFQAMSGFIFGCGISENYTQEMCRKKQLEQEAEHDRLVAAQLKKKMIANNKQIKYSHMNSNETDSENEEEEDDEAISEQDIDEEFDIYSFNESDDFSNDSDRFAVNRTLSNSSASSCEIGIDSLLKEMQMIQADDKIKQQYACGNAETASRHMPVSELGVTPTQMFIKTTSGTNTLTNSPISSAISTGYLSDLSNKTTFVNSHPKASTIHQQFTDLHDENADKKNSNQIDMEEVESDLDSNERDSNNNHSDNKHFKKHHHQQTFSRRSASLSNTSRVAKESSALAPAPAPVAVPVSVGSKQAEMDNSYMLKYVHDPSFDKLNFKNADQSLRLEYYTWENQGYRTANSFYPDICDFLDNKFRIASTLTYNTMGSHKQVDTSPFRRAVWLYTHSLFGIRYDDYDYFQTKQLIGSPLRKYIKILCSCPESITKNDYDCIMKEFTHSEKVHINIIIMEARTQASLLYFLRAINSYLSSASL